MGHVRGCPGRERRREAGGGTTRQQKNAPTEGAAVDALGTTSDHATIANRGDRGDLFVETGRPAAPDCQRWRSLTASQRRARPRNLDEPRASGGDGVTTGGRSRR